MSNYAIFVKPSATAGTSSSSFVDGVPYNSATIPYNSASILYGGFINIYGPIHPSILSIKDHYTEGHGTSGVVLYAGMPMGLLLDLTYATSSTISL